MAPQRVRRDLVTARTDWWHNAWSGLVPYGPVIGLSDMPSALGCWCPRRSSTRAPTTRPPCRCSGSHRNSNAGARGQWEERLPDPPKTGLRFEQVSGFEVLPTFVPRGMREITAADAPRGSRPGQVQAAVSQGTDGRPVWRIFEPRYIFLHRDPDSVVRNHS